MPPPSGIRIGSCEEDSVCSAALVPRGVRHLCNRTNYSIDRANTSELPARAATPVVDGYRPTLAPKSGGFRPPSTWLAGRHALDGMRVERRVQNTTWIDNVFIERLWRTVKYEEIYCMPTGTGAMRGSSCRPSLRFTTAGVCTRRSTTARQTKCISQLTVVGWLKPPEGIRWPRRASETRIQPMPRAGLAAYDVGFIGWLPRRTMIRFPPPVHFDVRGEAERAVRRIAKCSVFKCDASGEYRT